MWSRLQFAPVIGCFLGHLLNIIFALQVPQASGDLRAFEAYFSTNRGGQSFREDLIQ